MSAFAFHESCLYTSFALLLTATVTKKKYLFRHFSHQFTCTVYSCDFEKGITTVGCTKLKNIRRLYKFGVDFKPKFYSCPFFFKKKRGGQTVVKGEPTNITASQNIRKTAIPLMQHLVERFFENARAAPYQLSVTSVLPTTYQQSQVWACMRLFPAPLKFEFFIYLLLNYQD